MKYPSLQLPISVLVSIMLCFEVLQAQTQTELPKSLPANADEFSLQKRHHAGWGVSFAEGDATFGRDEGEFLFSTFYSYSLNQNLDIELALHYLAVQRFYTVLELSGGRDSLSKGVASTAWHGDLSFLWSNFTSIPFLKNFRIGGGLSLRTATLVEYEHANIVAFTQSAIMPRPFVGGAFTYTNQVNAGISLKAEYGITLSSTVELTLRAQLHYLPISLLIANGRNEGGSFSIGGFLRLNW